MDVVDAAVAGRGRTAIARRPQGRVAAPGGPGAGGRAARPGRRLVRHLRAGPVGRLAPGAGRPPRPLGAGRPAQPQHRLELVVLMMMSGHRSTRSARDRPGPWNVLLTG